MLTGSHILGDIHTHDVKKLQGLRKTKFFISKTLKKFHLHELGNFYHQFDNSGFTGIISLTESHIAIHTWPEFEYLTLDIYLCNYSKNNTAITKAVFREISNYFSPVKVKKIIVNR